MSVIFCYLRHISDSASFDREMEGFSLCMGSVISVLDILKLIIVFFSTVTVSNETKLEAFMLMATMVFWFCYSNSSHADIISGTLIFELAQLAIEIYKHIIVVESNARLDGRDCLFL